VVDVVLGHTVGYMQGDISYTPPSTKNPRYTDVNDDLDRRGLADRNYLLLMARGLPPRVIVELLGDLIDICANCAGPRPADRMTCSRRCANAINGRKSRGHPKGPMPPEIRAKHSEPTRRRRAAERAAAGDR
jgi:hypothetical protein